MIQPPMIQPPVIQPLVVEIKKYANRRLYDTSQSAYITVSDLAEMVTSGTKIKVSDAKSGEDLTSITLLQILMEQCQDGVQAISANSLSHIIAYGTAKTALLLQAHLDEAIQGFDDSQDGRNAPPAHADHTEMRDALQQLNAAFARFQK